MARERTARVEQALLGTRPAVAFRGHGQDTVTPGQTHRRILLYATRPGCDPCRRFSTLLAEALSIHQPAGVELWITGAAERHELDLLLRTGTPARDLHAIDAEGFRRAFQIEGLPYLVALDQAGIVRHVQLGYWEGMTLPWLEAFIFRTSD